MGVKIGWLSCCEWKVSMIGCREWVQSGCRVAVGESECEWVQCGCRGVDSCDALWDFRNGCQHLVLTTKSAEAQHKNCWGGGARGCFQLRQMSSCFPSSRLLAQDNM
eukprot:1160335-Pelagomonas_calceolata.AAC.6